MAENCQNAQLTAKAKEDNEFGVLKKTFWSIVPIKHFKKYIRYGLTLLFLISCYKNICYINQEIFIKHVLLVLNCSGN